MSERDSGGGGGGEGRRRRLEGVIPELLKRAVEIGVEKATEAPDTFKSFVGDLKIPKEVAHLLLTQMEDTKNGLFRVVAKEMRDFLEHTNLAGEMKKALTTVQFEINTTIRFTPNDGAAPAPPPEPEGDAERRGDKSRDKRASDRESVPPPSHSSHSPHSPLSSLSSIAPSVSSMLPEVKTDVQVTTREPRSRRRSRE